MSAPALKLTREVSTFCRRNLGIFAPALQKSSDPIQELFLQKIREYKSKTAGGKLVEPSPEMEKQLKNDKERVLNQFGVAAGEDVKKFPTFNFPEPKYENPGLSEQ